MRSWLETKRKRRNINKQRDNLNKKSICQHSALVLICYPATPQNEAGILIDPPISVPIPNTEPPAAIKPPSPPDEPPLHKQTNNDKKKGKANINQSISNDSFRFR